MINRNQTKENKVDELMEQVAPEVKSLIENFDPDAEVPGIVEIDNIEDLTADEFYDPKMNRSFNAHNSDHFLLDDKGRIGFKCEIYDFDENLIGEYTFWRESLGKALEDYNVLCLALIAEIANQFFEFRISRVVRAFYEAYRDKLSNQKMEDIDAKSDKIYYSKIKGTKGLDKILEIADQMEKEQI